MARVTIEDCLEHVENRFDLIVRATRRAHQLASTGAEPGVPWDNDKPTVVALREFAEGMTNLADREEARIKGLDLSEFDESIDDDCDGQAV